MASDAGKKERQSRKVGNVMPWKDKNGKQVVKGGKLSWRLRWNLKNAGTSKREYEYKTFHGTRREAEAEWIKHEATIRDQGTTYAKPSRETVKDYLAQWLKGKTPDLRPSTVDSYERMIRCHVVPALGALAMSDLTPTHIQHMVDNMRTLDPTPSPRTIAYARTVLRIALQDAVRLNMLRSNPADRVKAPKQEPQQRDAFTLEQGETLFAAADRTRLGPLFRFMFFSGMRRGEVLALRWADVDFEAGTATVQRARVMVKGQSFEQGTKTAAGIRTVPLVRPAVEALTMQRDRQRFDQRAAGESWESNGLVFATADGKPLSPTNVSRDFRRLRNAARMKDAEGNLTVKLPELPLHALRHTAVSVLLRAGVPL